ncbi:MAG: methyltransferase [Candidatus Thiodiazotropha sp. (ex Monitilora ramsayi)]|nr:methyltransferase [Candidatus Thiodiazotropha sp. (ex Monitilora ramsayi)]
MSQRLKVRPRFLSAWLRNPRQVGAVLPSSDGLTQTMAAQVDRGTGLTVELGAGTGAVTSALLTRGVTPDRLIVVEKDQILAAELARHFPALRVLEGDAARLRKLLRRSALGLADNVVSSLPLLSMRTHTRIRVLAQIFAILHPEGKLVQFTYSPRPPVPVRLAYALGVEGERIERVFWNLPPANVWVYKRTRMNLTATRSGIKTLHNDTRAPGVY